MFPEFLGIKIKLQFFLYLLNILRKLAQCDYTEKMTTFGGFN